MFYAVNRINANDVQRILAYQLFQIAKKLTSGELLLLKTVFEAHCSGTFNSVTSQKLIGWAQDMAGRAGHGVAALVMRDGLTLEQQGLITARVPLSSEAS
jgi:hypothetical protein